MLRLAIIGILIVALFYESSRGIMFLLVGATGLGARRRLGMRLKAALVVGLLAIFLLPIATSRVISQQGAGTHGTASALVAHEANGLANPTGASTTFGVHASLVFNGLRSAFTTRPGRASPW